MIFDGNISPDSVRYAVCADWKDNRSWAARLSAQEAEGEQEELLPPIQAGKEQEEIVAQAQQQMAEETKDGRNCQQQGQFALVAQLALTFEVLAAFDGDEEPFATSPASGRCKQHCVRRAWD